MELTVQPQMCQQNVAFGSSLLRRVGLALPVLAGLALAGCNQDRFEKQTDDVKEESKTAVENLSAVRYNFDFDNTYLDAVTYTVGNNEKRLILDSEGNVDVEHTYKKDEKGNYIGFETIHYNSDGIGELYAHRVVKDDINDSVRITSQFDKDGNLICKDSIVSHKPYSLNNKDVYTTYGDSKLLK